jgi:hypothetical protein
MRSPLFRYLSKVWKTPFLSRLFNYRAKNDRDTKTGSGQTWEKLRQTVFVFQYAGADA